VLLRYYPDAGRQLEFHSDRYKIPYRACFCGTGSGKTIAGVFEDVSWCLENARIVGYVFEPTYKMVRRTLIPTLEHPKILGAPIISNPVVADYRIGDNRIDFENGSVLWFGSLEEPSMAEGPNIDFIHVDEAQYVRHFSEAWDVILRRLRGTGRFPPSRQGAWVTTTPPPLFPGDRLYEYFADPKTRNPLSRVYRWSLYDNPHTSDRYKQEIKASHHGSLAKRFIEGRFAPAGLGSYDFDTTIHEITVVDKWIVRAHDKAKLIRLADLRTFDYPVDFGWTNPSCILTLAFDGDGRAYVLDEFYKNRVQHEVLISEAKLMVETWGEGPLVCDRSEPQAIDSFARAGLNARADKSKREDGIHEVGGRFTVQEDGKPRIYVSSKCVNWIHEVMVYDADVKENDHAMDCTRYGIMAKLALSEPAWVVR